MSAALPMPMPTHFAETGGKLSTATGLEGAPTALALSALQKLWGRSAKPETHMMPDGSMMEGPPMYGGGGR
jgi:hypothetical protein